ncbi:MAG: NAD(+)/NADH kinase [Thermoanaerobaculia bacterium]
MSDSTPARRVGVVAKTSSETARATATELVEWLMRRGHTVLLDEATAKAASPPSFEPLTPEVSCDLVVVLGGDGTLLSVARRFAGGPPILGVNLGRLGFLTEVPRAGLYPALIELLAGRYTVEPRSLFDVELVRPDGTRRAFRALNDAVIAKSALARIIELRVTIEGHPVSRYRADGLVISTPTGSTAYNLSAGGPILHPLLPVAVLTPICPHTLTLRPLVVPDSSVLDISLETQREKVYLTIDGQEGTDLVYHDRIRITRCPQSVSLVRVHHRTVFDVLRGKLHWGE